MPVLTAVLMTVSRAGSGSGPAGSVGSVGSAGSVWESAPSRPAVAVLHRHGVGAPRPTRVRRARERPVRPRSLVVALPPTPPVAACRRVFVRRRITAPVLATFVVAGIVVGLSMLGSAGEPAVPDRTAVVQVAPGETLWELAERVAPQSPTEQVVERIRELNDMRGITIHPGQPLIVPDGGIRAAQP